CTREKLNAREANKASGRVYDKLFVRHWEAWADGRRNQLFLFTLGADGKASGTPALLTRGIDGDVPSKPFGDDSEYVFSPDGRTLYFNARIARHDEPWSTNFDIYRVAIEGDAAPENLTPGNPAWDGYPL
ncbi:peptidase S9 prolyl oligopeptidase active site domain protein, partial [mine drainage metagenome]